MLKILSASTSGDVNSNSGSLLESRSDTRAERPSTGLGGRSICMLTSISLVAGINDEGLDEFLLGVSPGIEDEEAAEDIGGEEWLVVGGLEALLSVEFVLLFSTSLAAELLLAFTILLKAAEAGSGGNMMSAGTVGNDGGCGKQLW